VRATRFVLFLGASLCSRQPRVRRGSVRGLPDTGSPLDFVVGKAGRERGPLARSVRSSFRRQFGSGTGSTSLVGGFDSDRSSQAYALSLFPSAAQPTFRRRPTHRFGNTEHRRPIPEWQAESVSAFYALSRFPWQAPLGLSLARKGRSADPGLSSFDGRPGRLPPRDGVRDSGVTRNGNKRCGGYGADASLSASVSWGRVRDATPVYQSSSSEQAARNRRDPGVPRMRS
jgi:hypothetical protein